MDSFISISLYQRFLSRVRGLDGTEGLHKLVECQHYYDLAKQSKLKTQTICLSPRYLPASSLLGNRPLLFTAVYTAVHPKGIGPTAAL